MEEEVNDDPMHLAKHNVNPMSYSPANLLEKERPAYVHGHTSTHQTRLKSFITIEW